MGFSAGVDGALGKLHPSRKLLGPVAALLSFSFFFKILLPIHRESDIFLPILRECDGFNRKPLSG